MGGTAMTTLLAQNLNSELTDAVLREIPVLIVVPAWKTSTDLNFGSITTGKPI